jgi:hypothetical protein
LHSINGGQSEAKHLLVFAQDSEDTNVLVLLIRRYPKLPCLSFVVQASGVHVSIRSIYNSLREMKSFALPGFHAISGCDTTGTGCLNGKSKLSSILESI